MADDSRLRGQEKYLTGIALTRCRWTQTRVDWDHDHCQFCWQAISDRGDDLREGWTDADEYWWICDECFSDFRERFGWRVEA